MPRKLTCHDRIAQIAAPPSLMDQASGVYYTPTYIADYIVRQTVGRLVEETAAKETGCTGDPRLESRL